MNFQADRYTLKKTETPVILQQKDGEIKHTKSDQPSQLSPTELAIQLTKTFTFYTDLPSVLSTIQ